MNTLKGSQFVKIKRKDGSFFVAEFPEGEHRSFNLGPLPKPVFGMQKQDEQFKTKDGLVDHYLFVGEQARESTTTFAPSEAPETPSASAQTSSGLDEPTKPLEVPERLPVCEDIYQARYIVVEAMKIAKDQFPELLTIDRKERMKIILPIAADLHAMAKTLFNDCEEVINEVFKK